MVLLKTTPVCTHVLFLDLVLENRFFVQQIKYKDMYLPITQCLVSFFIKHRNYLWKSSIQHQKCCRLLRRLLHSIALFNRFIRERNELVLREYMIQGA
jgi:hypothetical protein